MKNGISNKIKVINQLAVILTLTVCIGIINLIALIPEELDVEYILENYAMDIDSFVAEKTETLMYLTSIVCFPILYLIFNRGLNVILKNKDNEKKYRIVNIILNYIGLIIAGGIIFVSILRKGIYYTDGIIYLNWKVCIPLVILSILTILYSSKIKDNKIYQKIIYVIIALILLVIGYMYIDSTSEHNVYELHHFNAYYYPVLKINSGLTPGVDFNSIYGYYSYFFALLTQGNMYSLLLFNSIVAILVVIVFSCIAKFLNSVVKNKLIVLYTFLAIIYCSVLQQIMWVSAPYLQYVPHRILFPAIILAYISFYLKHIDIKRKSLLQIIGFGISSFALFWNLDTGVVVLGTWLIVLGYETLMTNSLKDKNTYLKVLKIIGMAIASVIVYILLLNIIALVRTGMFVGINNIIFGQSNFIGSGFNMKKMRLVHPWLILAIVYMIGLMIPLCALCNKRIVGNVDKYKLKKCISILALSILGCGIFTYYQGRSHDMVFYSVVYPSLILIAIYLEYLIENLKSTSKTLKPLKYLVIIAIISVLSLISITSLYSLIFNKNIRSLYNKEKHRDKYDYTEIDKINDIVPNIDFLLDYEAYYYIRYERKDTKKMSSYVDLFSYEDYKKVFDVIRDIDNLCTSEKVYKVLMTKYEDEFEEIKENYNIYLKHNLCIILDKEKMRDQHYESKLINIGYKRVI